MADTAPVVFADWLAAHLRDDLCILDIRSAVDGGGAAAYEQAHIPGAVHTDYVKDGWRASKGMATGMLPDKAALAALFAHLGLRPDQHVVVVGAGTSPADFSAAARVYWTLKIAGHRRLSILAGGMAAWRQHGGPLESGRRAPAPAPGYPIERVDGLRADLAAVERIVAERGAILLDSRPANYFEGRAKSPQARRAGRLPGATHLDYTHAFDPTAGRLKTQGELEALFALPALPVVNYCNTGQQAAANWFILSELLGRPQVRLYDGSMSEWTEDEQRPVEVGAAGAT
ncbi:MAG TPA: rhodanese-like domain-containing protein [Xanthobacteraceae bacterium]